LINERSLRWSVQQIRVCNKSEAIDILAKSLIGADDNIINQQGDQTK